MQIFSSMFFLLLLLQSYQLAEFACCSSNYIRFGVQPDQHCKNYLDSYAFFWTNSCFNFLCADLSAPKPCCGVGDCDIFCCNCVNDCIEGNIVVNIIDKFGSDIMMIAGGPDPPTNTSVETINSEELD